MSPLWRFYFLGYLMALPHTLVGLLLALVYRCHSWRWHDGCLEAIAGQKPDGETRIWGSPAAQTHGWVIFYDSEAMRQYAPVRVHERVLVWQGFIGGPVYAIVYVICHLWAGYEKNPFEVQAYKRMARKKAWGTK